MEWSVKDTETAFKMGFCSVDMISGYFFSMRYRKDGKSMRCLSLYIILMTV